MGFELPRKTGRFPIFPFAPGRFVWRRQKWVGPSAVTCWKTQTTAFWKIPEISRKKYADFVRHMVAVHKIVFFGVFPRSFSLFFCPVQQFFRDFFGIFRKRGFVRKWRLSSSLLNWFGRWVFFGVFLDFAGKFKLYFLSIFYRWISPQERTLTYRTTEKKTWLHQYLMSCCRGPPDARFDRFSMKINPFRNIPVKYLIFVVILWASYTHRTRIESIHGIHNL